MRDLRKLLGIKYPIEMALILIVPNKDELAHVLVEESRYKAIPVLQ